MKYSLTVLQRTRVWIISLDQFAFEIRVTCSTDFEWFDWFSIIIFTNGYQRQRWPQQQHQHYYQLHRMQFLLEPCCECVYRWPLCNLTNYLFLIQPLNQQQIEILIYYNRPLEISFSELNAYNEVLRIDT